ncbi:hypothetical protein CVT26_002937 [Gymnopilus dilepis]|uniref:Uncharacterized protein n=1 Tax=Gymnopilus dilepis TaxID=231916 RepID=A0A409Y4H5_9AGAR|nr:hypothetical protein CVT26_002937 [Gymnopilus dilepis]
MCSLTPSLSMAASIHLSSGH